MYYKDLQNKLHSIDSIEFSKLLPAGSVQITDAEVDAIRLANAPPQARITRVTMRQARLALMGAGLLSAVNAAIAGMTGAAGDAARIEWEYSQEVQRDNGLVESLGVTIGLTESQLDELFATANAIL
jgi:hypothetical protein